MWTSESAYTEARAADTRHLFLDTDALREWDAGIIQRFPQAEKMPITGLEPGPVGAWDARGTEIYGSVLKENGRFRMWYCAFPDAASLDDVYDHSYVCYAESDDGIRWRKPDLRLAGQLRYPGNNLLPLPGFVMGVVRALPATGTRYLAACIVNPYGRALEPDIWGEHFEFNGHGTYFFGSDDGLRWRQLTPQPPVAAGDVACLVADPAAGRYLLYQKILVNHGLETRRAFTCLQSRDGIHWEGGGDERPGSWPEHFLADDYDDLQAAQAGFKIADHYDVAVHRVGDLYVGVETIFQIGLPLRFGFNQNPNGLAAFRLAYSHDGLVWRHPKGRPLWMTTGAPGAFDAGFLVSATTFVEHDDHLLLYYTGNRYDHGALINPDFTVRADVSVAARRALAAIGLARIRRDRFAALTATYKGRFSVEAGCRQGDGLLVNARCPEGCLRMAIAARNAREPLPGFTFEDCVPFTGDATRAPIRFRAEKVADIPADKPLHLHFEVCRGELYGYEWGR